MVTGLIVLGIVALAALAEWLHARRCRFASRLAFGPHASPRPWVVVAPWLRIAGAGLTAWGLLTLIHIAPAFFNPEELAERQKRHLILVLDVSPSMHIEDSGLGGTQKRIERAGTVVRSLLHRLAMDQVLISVVAVYSEARPVVTEARDLAVIKNILGDLPLDQAFDHGKTDLFSGVEAATELAKDWPEGSATLLIVSDGETLPEMKLPRMPRSVAATLVAGVGNPRRGTLIDGEQSRQDAATLRRLAGRLGGTYFDANEKHLPSEAIDSVDEALPMKGGAETGLRELALASVFIGALILAGLPFALGLGGAAPLREQTLSRSSTDSSNTNFNSTLPV